MSEEMKLDALSVGYHGNALIHDITLSVGKGEIITLIGPNGAGKSTILKTITRQLAAVSGRVSYQGKDVNSYSYADFSLKMAVVLTDRIHPEMMTCRDIAATGRYPYTGRLGILTEKDERIVEEALKMVQAEEVADRDFNAVSDGQRQRVLLARAIAQEPETIVLDEPTSFLDIHHKLGLLNILKNMARRKNITIIMSLHEIDLAMKISDRIVCVKGEKIFRIGAPEEIFDDGTIRELYDIEDGWFDTKFGSIELPAVSGEPEAFVISSGGSGIPVYRKLQRTGVPFAAGILYTNDIDYQLAKRLAAKTVTAEAFSEITEEQIQEAERLMDRCARVINAGAAVGTCNRRMEELIRYAEKSGKLETAKI